jgi:hypothetical protein
MKGLPKTPVASKKGGRQKKVTIAQEPDKGYGASHGYGQGHGGPSGPGDVPAKPASGVDDTDGS